MTTGSPNTGRSFIAPYRLENCDNLYLSYISPPVYRVGLGDGGADSELKGCAIAIGEAVTSLVCFFTTLRIAAAESRSSGA